MKSTLVITRKAPQAGLNAREALDLVLSGAAFEIPLALLFIEDAVFQLLKDQQPKCLAQKDITANLQALSMFGVEQLYVDEQSLIERGLSLDDLLVLAKPIKQSQLSHLLSQFDHVVSL
ncbi:sulfurtransferase complex subunit TusC [Pseudomonas sp. F1_0610]|uniref:sulfurtransferase complex subunit TusC n=1 Tax=Pseudomonas sp. F1_0610 TaxID=3114284 RepID=UPI0039C466DB